MQVIALWRQSVAARAAVAALIVGAAAALWLWLPAGDSGAPSQPVPTPQAGPADSGRLAAAAGRVGVAGAVAAIRIVATGRAVVRAAIARAWAARWIAALSGARRAGAQRRA